MREKNLAYPSFNNINDLRVSPLTLPSPTGPDNLHSVSSLLLQGASQGNSSPIQSEDSGER